MCGSCVGCKCFNHHPPPVVFADSTGCIVQGFDNVEDPAVSIYTGGNLTFSKAFSGEVEGTVVVDGDLTNEHSGLLAGKPMWGMGFYPPANADMLIVGGNVKSVNRSYVSGNTRVGGTVTPADQLQIATKTYLESIHAPQQWIDSWAYQNQNQPSIKSRLGKIEALKADMDGNGTIVDYNNYVTTMLKPLSTELASKSVTGNVTVGKAPDQANWIVQVADKWNSQWSANTPIWRVSISNEGLITFTGDGQKHPQVFTVNTASLTSYASQHKLNGAWDLAFTNIPDGQPIIINVTGTTVDWTPGWRVWVNGQDYSTAINRTDASLNRYRSIASRIIWNYPNTSKFTLSKHPVSGYEYITKNTNGSSVWKRVPATETVKRGTLFPGSILLPNGSMLDEADTNGRILVGKNLTLDIWEHHNAPWIGLPDTPQCFTVGGKTSASLG